MTGTRRRLPRPVIVPLALLAACSTGTPPATTSPEAPPPARAEPDDAVREANLRGLLADFAADSVRGRAAGSREHYRATAYLAARAQALGLQPAGVDGTYFQEVPIRTRTPYSDATVEGHPIELATGAVPVPPTEGFVNGTGGSLSGVAVVYGGRMFGVDEIPAEEGRGRVVVLAPGIGPDGVPAFGVAPQTVEKFLQAEAVVVAGLELAPGGIAEALAEPGALLVDGTDDEEGPLLILATSDVGERLIGGAFEEVAPGTPGVAMAGSIGFRDTEPDAPTRNVIAVVRGTDPVLRDEYVVVSAHSDHLAPVAPVADHDSLRAYLQVVRPRGAEDPERAPTAEEAVRIGEIRAGIDANGAPRPDSIRNGADDDGSGSVALLEIGRTFVASPPRRSVLLVWHTAEEVGLFGAQYFTDHPTVPLDDIVAALNMDMIGRGGAGDLPGGGAGYLQLIGSRRLSTQLGDLVETVNEEDGYGFAFDYTFDADGHPDNYYCRSDHYMYARYGIPIVFFSTGGHEDYHQVTDEPGYIDYAKLGRVTSFVAAVADRVGRLDDRVVVDGPLLDPNAPCQQ